MTALDAATQPADISCSCCYRVDMKHTPPDPCTAPVAAPPAPLVALTKSDDAAAAVVWAQREAAACAGALPADHVKAPLPGLGEASFLLILK